MKPVSSIISIGTTTTQIGILGKARRRGEQGFPEWSDVARCEATVDLEVGSGHVATIAGSD